MSNEPFIIVGLGNPGRKYENTRHNLGFMVVDQLAKNLDIPVTKLKFKALIGEGRVGRRKVVLVKPQTYMNLSGDAVRQIVDFYKIPWENLMVIYDDFDIELGQIRMRKFGSAGTHNGMRDIVKKLSTDRFPRMRMGIDTGRKGELIDFVVGGISKSEGQVLGESIEKAADAVVCYIEDGIDNAMNRYNTKKQKAKNE